VAPTQDALYAEIDLDLSWSEKDLPERERTRHVHRLHPYLGKFIPQLVEVLLARYVPRGGRVLDPFAGSGTTLVQGLESGYDGVGVDLAAFNCLLMEVKTRCYDLFSLESEIREVVRLVGPLEAGVPPVDGYLGRWFSPKALAELLHFRGLAREFENADVLWIVLARAARSARLTTHFDLDFPRSPQTDDYWCHKHKRMCRPVDRAEHFLRRYALDTLARIKAFSRVRGRGREAVVVHGDSREVDFGGPFDGLITSPPYPGLIDYHEQHRYAYELLGLKDLRGLELGSGEQGTSATALAAYVEGVSEVLERGKAELRPRAPVVIVVSDRRKLYPEILDRAGLRLQQRLRRHVNRRTGRRAGEFYEDVLVALPN
jgi:DNA methylase